MGAVIHVGEAELQSVLEYEGNPMPLGFMFEQATERDLSELATWFQGDKLTATPADSIVELTWRTWVLQLAGWTMLLDTGLGNDKTREHPIDFCDHLHTPYLARLAALGVTPADVDAVVCTHLHFDHVGWNTTLSGGRWVPTFPNARYLLPTADLAHYASADADHVTFPSFVDSVRPVMEQGMVDPIGTATPPLEYNGVEMTFQPVPGHSPGSTMVRIVSGGQRISFIGDLMHHPIQLVDPDLSLGIEENPCLSAQHRRRFLTQVADTSELVAPAHFPGSGIGRVVTSPSGRGYAWVPAS